MKTKRHDEIMDLISNYDIETQEEVVGHMAASAQCGLEAGPATVAEINGEQGADVELPPLVADGGGGGAFLSGIRKTRTAPSKSSHTHARNLRTSILSAPRKHLSVPRSSFSRSRVSESTMYQERLFLEPWPDLRHLITLVVILNNKKGDLNFSNHLFYIIN